MEIETSDISLHKPSVESLVLRINEFYYDTDAGQAFANWFEGVRIFFRSILLISQMNKNSLLLRRIRSVKNKRLKCAIHLKTISMKLSDFYPICLLKSLLNFESALIVFLPPKNKMKTGWPTLVVWVLVLKSSKNHFNVYCYWELCPTDVCGRILGMIEANDFFTLEDSAN